MEQFYLSKIPVLDENNWDVWKIKMKLVLEKLELWPLKSDDEKCYSILFMSLDDFFSRLVRDIQNPIEIWNILEDHFRPKETNIHDSNVVAQSGDEESLDKKCSDGQQLMGVSVEDEPLVPDLAKPFTEIEDQEEIFEEFPPVGEIDLDEPESESIVQSIMPMETISCKSEPEQQKLLDFENCLERFLNFLEDNLLVMCDLEIEKELEESKTKLLKLFEEIDDSLKKEMKSDYFKNDEMSNIFELTASTSVGQTVNFSIENELNHSDSVLDEVIASIEPSNLAKQSVIDTPEYFKVNHLFLWYRLRLLDPEFLAKVDRFYTNDIKYQVWLFLKDGRVFHFGHKKIFSVDTKEIDDLVEVPELSQQKVISVHSGCQSSFYMFLTEDGKLFAYGQNRFGLGSGFETLVDKPVIIANNIIQVDTGNYHILALNDKGEILSAGSNSKNQILFRKPNKFLLENICFFESKKFKMICCYLDSSAALSEINEIFVWGSINGNQYRNPKMFSIDEKVPVKKIMLSNRDLVIFHEGSLINCFTFESEHGYKSSYQKQKRPKHTIDFKSRFIECFQLPKNSFVFIDADGYCFKWYVGYCNAIATGLKSLPDTGYYFSNGNTIVLAKLSTELIQQQKNLDKLNEISTADLIFQFEDRRPPIYVHRDELLKHSDYFSKETGNGDLKVDSHYYYEFYIYLYYVYNGSLLVPMDKLANQHVCNLRSLARKFGDTNFEKEINRLALRN